MHMNPLLALLFSTSVLAAIPGYGNYYESECPPEKISCSHNGSNYTLGAKGAPECWSKSEAGAWACEPLDTKTECPDGSVNVEVACSDSDTPSCPEADQFNLQCSSGGSESTLAGEPGANICWSKDPENFDWVCRGTGENNSCSRGELNISTCKFDPPPYKAIKCPGRDDVGVRCDGPKGERNSFLRPGLNTCWSKAADGKSWKCGAKTMGLCEEGKLDISTCPINDQRPICPGEEYYTLRAVSKEGLVAKAGAPGKLKCWSKPDKFITSWRCSTMEDNDCKNDELDITTCSFVKPLKECQDRNLKCKNKKNESFDIFNPNAPGCWSSDGDNSFTCDSRPEASLFCPKGSDDIRSCYPKCPKLDASCEINGEVFSPINAKKSKRADLLCWDPNNGNIDPLSFNCYGKNPKTGLCPSRTLELSGCNYDHSSYKESA